MNQSRLRDSHCKDELTNLEELLFLTVFALPKASNRGLDCRMTFFTCVAVSPPPDTCDRKFMMYLAATVLPAPDSPLKTKENERVDNAWQ